MKTKQRWVRSGYGITRFFAMAGEVSESATQMNTAMASVPFIFFVQEQRKAEEKKEKKRKRMESKSCMKAEKQQRFSKRLRIKKEEQESCSKVEKAVEEWEVKKLKGKHAIWL